jgi:hypothetical protein
MNVPKIELKKISFNERMSDETNCFIADLYIDGKKVGSCNNEGRGGPTDYHADTSCASGFTRANIELIAKAEAYCKTLPNVRSEALDFEYPQSLESVIDELLEAHLKAKDEAKRIKMYDKAICFGVPNGNSYRQVYWKGRTLAQIDKINLQRAYNDVKKGLKGGEVILNTNLVALGVNL